MIFFPPIVCLVVLSAKESFRNKENKEIEDSEKQYKSQHNTEVNIEKNDVVPPKSQETGNKEELQNKEKTSEDGIVEDNVGEDSSGLEGQNDYREIKQVKYDGKEKLESQRDGNKQVQEELKDQSGSPEVGKDDGDASKDKSLEETEEEGKEVNRGSDDGGSDNNVKEEKKSVYLPEEQEPEYGMQNLILEID